jgi:hypothetical protein
LRDMVVFFHAHISNIELGLPNPYNRSSLEGKRTSFSKQSNFSTKYSQFFLSKGQILGKRYVERRSPSGSLTGKWNKTKVKWWNKIINPLKVSPCVFISSHKHILLSLTSLSVYFVVFFVQETIDSLLYFLSLRYLFLSLDSVTCCFP